MDPAQTQHDRRVLRVSGPDARAFLQGLVTNDVDGLDRGAVYAALLTPQGKYLADFFLVADGPDILLDVSAAQAAPVMQKLSMYKLRSAVTIGITDLAVARGLGAAPKDAVADPRDAGMGWRRYGPGLSEDPQVTETLERRRVALGIPESGIELIPGESYILEAGFERLHGVDFRKGCYVGQEVVARMKHKTTLRKGLARVEVAAPVPIGTEIRREGKAVGTLYSQADGRGIAHLRLDRAGPGMIAGSVPVTLAAET